MSKGWICGGPPVVRHHRAHVWGKVQKPQSIGSLWGHHGIIMGSWWIWTWICMFSNSIPVTYCGLCDGDGSVANHWSSAGSYEPLPRCSQVAGISGWWLQPLWSILVNQPSIPNIGEIKNAKNYQLDIRSMAVRLVLTHNPVISRSELSFIIFEPSHNRT